MVEFPTMVSESSQTAIDNCITDDYCCIMLFNTTFYIVIGKKNNVEFLVEIL